MWRRCSHELGVLAACGLLVCPALAQETRSVPRVLLDRRLAEKPVQLTGVDDRTVMYLDAAGQARTDLLTDYLAILPAPDSPAVHPSARPASLIELRDSQRIVGTLVTSRTPPADSLLWEHPGLGALVFKLDDIRRFQLQGGVEIVTRAAEDATDLVALVNGDRLDGFVDSVGEAITIDIAGTPRSVPADRIQEVVLGTGGGNKPIAQASGAVVWISDGSVLACRNLQSSRTGDIVLTPRFEHADHAEAGTEAPAPPPQTLTMRLDDLRALAVDQSVLAPLASLKVVSESPGPGRRWSRGIQIIDPRWSALGLADVELPGPMTVEWELPPAAARFAAEIELPRQMWTWGDCEVVVSVISSTGESELWRRRVNAEAPRSRVIATLPASSRRLRVQMNAGEFGAVQDKVLLRRGVVVMESR